MRSKRLWCRTLNEFLKEESVLSCLWYADKCGTRCCECADSDHQGQNRSAQFKRSAIQEAKYKPETRPFLEKHQTVSCHRRAADRHHLHHRCASVRVRFLLSFFFFFLSFSCLHLSYMCVSHLPPFLVPLPPVRCWESASSIRAGRPRPPRRPRPPCLPPPPRSPPPQQPHSTSER